MKLIFRWMILLPALLLVSVNGSAWDETRNGNLLVFDTEGEVVATYHINDFTTGVTNPEPDKYQVASVGFDPDASEPTEDLELPGTGAVVPNRLNHGSPVPASGYPDVSFYGFDDADNTAYSGGLPVVSCDPGGGTFAETTAVTISVQFATNASYSRDGGLPVPFTSTTDIYIYKDTELTINASNGNGPTDKTYNFTIESPENADTDGDGYPDCWEVFYGLNPLSSDISTDTDGDGISDIDEILRGSNPDFYNTLVDSDGDGWSDLDEGLRGTNKDDPNDTPVAGRLYEVEQILSGTIYLDNGKTETAEDLPISVTSLDSVGHISASCDTNGAYGDLRLPAGEPLLIRGRGDGSPVHETYIAKRYIPFIADLSPLDMPEISDWGPILADPTEWTNLYLKFLDNNLVVTRAGFDITPESVQAVALLEREFEILAGLSPGLFFLAGSSSNGVPAGTVTGLKEILDARGQDMNAHMTEIDQVLNDAETCSGLKTELNAIYPDTDGADEKTTEQKTAELLQQKEGRYLAGLLLSGTYASSKSRATALGIATCNLLSPDGDADGDGLDNGDEVPDPFDPYGGSDLFDADSDNDGVPDGSDNCPNTANPDQLDYDNDGLGDLCDDDIDNDGLDNGTEILFGTSPYTWDTDEDGISDYDEWLGYESVEKPDNSRPLQPSLLSPSDGASGVEPTLILLASAFMDPDLPEGDYHSTTRWEIAHDTSFTDLAFVSDGDAHLTSLTIPALALTPGTRFYLRVKYLDRYGRESLWSETVSVTTADTGDDDSGNGIPDDQDVDGTVDLDGDAIPDIDQPEEIKCVNTIINNGIQICVKRGTNVSFIHNLVSVDPTEITDTLNRPAVLPAGLLRMRLETESVGAEASVIVLFSQEPDAGTIWFRYDETDGWEDFSGHTVSDSETNSITLTLKDGGFGDSDGVENGIILTTGGIDRALLEPDTPPDDPETNPGSGGGSSGGGGCFIKASSVDRNNMNLK